MEVEFVLQDLGADKLKEQPLRNLHTLMLMLRAKLMFLVLAQKR